ncbi:hypothetical protein K470DRAFT_255459 [Piedraia hortae CBS 480.64]|uniref:DUF7924 domain-containing protein n=1 Tax=Piedraia hortae CBS 480.64 TaxID=1314780 RepID=A0A6A7C6R0_9PEZI|nr:hypothetical protein K470DRAFT_255459 [Piedraia hortae CBS 480.64]
MQIRKVSNTDWERRIGDRTPRPDIAYGLNSTAFDKDELEQLERYEKYRPARFTKAGLYFPFFVFELKAKDISLDYAHVQACAAAATMIEAVRQLCQIVKPDEVDSLEGQILGFSMTHNLKEVNINGHFFIKDKERQNKIIYYFHPLYCASFEQDFTIVPKATHPLKSRALACVHMICKEHFIQHRDRIKGCLAVLPDVPDSQLFVPKEELELTSRKKPATGTTNSSNKDEKIIALYEDRALVAEERRKEGIQQVHVNMELQKQILKIRTEQLASVNEELRQAKERIAKLEAKVENLDKDNKELKQSLQISKNETQQIKTAKEGLEKQVNRLKRALASSVGTD